MPSRWEDARGRSGDARRKGGRGGRPDRERVNAAVLRDLRWKTYCRLRVGSRRGRDAAPLGLQAADLRAALAREYEELRRRPKSTESRVVKPGWPSTREIPARAIVF